MLSCIDVLVALVNDSSDGSSLMDAPFGNGRDAVVGCVTRMLRPSSGSKRNSSESLLSGSVWSVVEPLDCKKSKSDDWKTTAKEQNHDMGIRTKPKHSQQICIHKSQVNFRQIHRIGEQSTLVDTTHLSGRVMISIGLILG